jgi:cytochrome c peroxidase
VNVPVGVAVLALVVAACAHDRDAPVKLAPGDLRGAELGYTYGVGGFVADYTPPAPGTYTLPAIDTVADHPLVDSDGKRTTLFALIDGRVAVVSFVYMTCVEAAGCPASLGLQHRLDRALAEDATLGERVRLLTISFDPERDTPARLSALRRLHRPRSDWQFATAPGETELTGLLADFGQPVARLRFDDGRWTGLFRHVLKVYLVDARRQVRNVYSVEFMNPQLVVNDVRTVLSGG